MVELVICEMDLMHFSGSIFMFSEIATILFTSEKHGFGYLLPIVLIVSPKGLWLFKIWQAVFAAKSEINSQGIFCFLEALSWNKNPSRD